ncbi:hypothetical protein GGS24DRAFT_484795 [Hypoxylon argillaceum]|nr:hypothetical protein GGS24DRAFT_484795 [Hypoxylon argillaceum]
MAGTPRSCTSCRQAKVGCDARKKPVNTPCSRCSKNNIECRFDKNFKRILTRKLTANLTNELHQLRTSQAAFERGVPYSPEIPLREPESLSPHVPFFFTNVAEPLSDFSIGDISIPARTMVELMQHFGNQYHVNAHFIQPVESLASFHSASPLLFWTIVLLASRFHSEHGGLYEQLLSPHEQLLRSLSTTAIQSIHEIHALLLLCLWPIPKRPEWSSPTWNYIVLAAGACMRLNLDKSTPRDPVEIRSSTPEHSQKHEEARIRTRKLTWLACLAISTQEASFLGLLPPLSCSLYLKRSRKAMEEVKDYCLPSYRPRLAIYEIICNYSLVLEEVDGCSAQISLVETFDGSLDRIRQTFSAEMNTDVDVLLQYAKMNLYAAALVRILGESEGECSQHLVDIQTLIIRGSKASSRLISNVKAIIDRGFNREGQPGHTISPHHYPRYYLEVIFFAAIFIFRTSYMRPSTTRDVAIEGLIRVYNIYQLFPDHLDAKSGVDGISHILRFTSSEEFSYVSSPIGGLTTTNRLGASFVWDTLLHIPQLAPGVGSTAPEDDEPEESQTLDDTLATPSPGSQDTMAHQIAEISSRMPLPITLDWGDIDLTLPPFDIFGLDAGEHIVW